MYVPTPAGYRELSRRYNMIPVSYECIADTLTPVTVFKRVSRGRPGYLLESVEGGEKVARYSFIGLEPYLIYTQKGRTGLLREGTGGRRKRVTGNPFKILERLVTSVHAPAPGDLPRFFGGAVGCFGYGLARWLEEIPPFNRDDLGLQDCYFLFCGKLIIFDHVRRTLQVVINSFPGDSAEASYSRATRQIEEILAVLEKGEGEISKDDRADDGRRSNLLEGGCRAAPGLETVPGREGFLTGVKKAKEYIRRGDIFQVVLSQRFSRPFLEDPFQVYRRLRSLNPSPYMFFLDFGGLVVAGSSPEMLVRVEGGEVRTRPIAGTRPRGKSPEEDRILARELLEDPKERAEHVMLVDLGRNDLARVCSAGTVTAEEFMKVEKYSHVMHLVSSVRGLLAPGKSAFDALRACFPAGTVSGAPKVRAMEIISELENFERGLYAGAVGYAGFNGNLDTAITIRTIVFHRGWAHVQAGAGIVADSDPEKEYLETVNKARVLLEVLDSGAPRFSGNFFPGPFRGAGFPGGGSPAGND